jgi:hypothetical protein
MRLKLFSPETFCLCVLFAFCMVGCSKDTFIGGDVEEQCERFFDTSGSNDNLQRIAALLKLKNDTSVFVPVFVSDYGYPIWKEAYAFPEDGRYVYAVPVKSEIPGSEIESIWFFSMGKSQTNYHLYSRGKSLDAIEGTWMFDYFTRNYLHKKPISGLILRPVVAEAGTRGFTETGHCVHAFVQAGNVEDDKGWHCWTSIDYETDPLAGDAAGGGGSDDGGGGGTSGSVDHGSSDTEDNDYSDTEDGGEDVDPCAAAQKLSRDAAIRARISELFSDVLNYRVGTTEYGWVKTANGNILRPTSRKEGSMSYSPSALAGAKITERYHTHPGGGAPFPSWADLVALSTDYKNGRIDVDDFSYGVISIYGCFSIVVTSEDAFGGFANKVYQKDKDLFDAWNEI